MHNKEATALGKAHFSLTTGRRGVGGWGGGVGETTKCSFVFGLWEKLHEEHQHEILKAVHCTIKLHLSAFRA